MFTNIIWIYLLVLCLERCLVHSQGETCGYPDLPANSDHIFREGDQVRYTCKEGFHISGNTVRQCQNSRWTEARFTCNAVMCPTLNDIPHGQIFQDSSDGVRDNYESVAEYTCIRGFRIFGTELEYRRTCQLNGTWSGQEPYCEVPTCDEIGPFPGRKVFYLGGNRHEHSLAFYICDDGYTLYRESTQTSECTEISGELVWSPKPPACYKTLSVVVPANCSTRSSKNEITHLQSYNLSPKSGYEFYSFEDYLTVNFVKIINTNGHFDPPLPECVPERCATWTLDNTDVYYNNNTRAMGKIDSHVDYNFACTSKYEFAGRLGMPNVIRGCEFGRFINVPKCVPRQTSLKVKIDRAIIDTEEGRTARFVCTITGTNRAMRYILSWSRQGGQVPSKAIEQNGVLTIPNVRRSDAGNYVCKGSNMFIMDEEVAVLTVTGSTEQAPAIRIEPRYQAVDEGLPVRFQCVATGSPKPRVEWYRGRNREMNPNAVITTDGEFRIPRVTTDDESDYYCKATNDIGTTELRTILYVNKVDRPSVNIIVRQTKYVTVVGDTVRLECYVKDNTGRVTLFWSRAAVSLPAGSTQDSGILTLPNVQPSYAGNYVCNGADSESGRISTAVAVLEVSVDANCTLHESSIYNYTDSNGIDLILPHTVNEGAHVTVQCKYPAVDDYYSYDYYSTGENETITCKNGTLPEVSLYCKDFSEQPPVETSHPCEQFVLRNGIVTHNVFGEYYVFCNIGYTLNLPHEGRDRPCKCSGKELICFAGRKPMCEADTCDIPLYMDHRLTIYQMPNRVYLSAGDQIQHDSFVFFNCSDVSVHKYEPANRRFRCVLGRWRGADRNNPNWDFGNNGTFPTCRKATCEPPCENSGVCFRDGECRCQHMTKGARCQIPLCDDQCAINGGTCLQPGNCGNCPDNRHGDNCELENTCDIPLYMDHRLTIYQMPNRVYLSAGDQIQHDSFVFFNCSNVSVHKYEPANRQFRCVLGRWRGEDRNNPNWDFGNNGTFPTCRKATCEPPCENSGVCFRDGECRCQHMTKGARCQIPLCDDQCAINGGTCLQPGNCGNCPDNRHGDNCELENTCKLPHNAARHHSNRGVFGPREKIRKDDMRCDSGQVMSSELMTCQQNGTWTNIIKCLKTNFKYAVSIQVADRFGADTVATVYVLIDGQDLHTKVFTMNGNFGRNELVENEFRGIDVGPIQRVDVSKSMGALDDNVMIEYVSVYIEETADYYLFTKQDQPFWLKADTPTSVSLVGKYRYDPFVGKAILSALEKSFPNAFGVDVYFVIDVSNDIDGDKMKSRKQLMNALLPKLGINDGQSGTRLAFYFFASTTYVAQNQHYISQEQLFKNDTEAQEYIDSLDFDKIRTMTIPSSRNAPAQSYYYGSGSGSEDDAIWDEDEFDEEEYELGTAITTALEDVAFDIRMKHRMRILRRRAQQIVILISAGEYNTDVDPTEVATQLKLEPYSAEIYSIMIGTRDIKRDKAYQAMRKIASVIEDEKHFFEIGNEEDLSNMIDAIINDGSNWKCGTTDPIRTRLTEEDISVYEHAAMRHAWPWMAQLVMADGALLCGGSLINQQWILTAAHCIERTSTIILKKLKMADKEGVEEFHIQDSSKFKHPKYNEKKDLTYLYDVALIKLPREVEISRELLPVCLPHQNETKQHFNVGEFGVVTGWGKSNPNGQTADGLKQMQMSIKDCSGDDKSTFDPTTMFCAGGNDGGKIVDTCQGDSGGPFTVRIENEEDTFVQIGVVSSGERCKKDDKNGYYTKLTAEVIDWINEVTTST